MIRILLSAICIAFISNSSHGQVKKQPAKKWITVSGKISFLNPADRVEKVGYNINKVIAGKGMGRSFKATDSVEVKADGSYSIKLDATIPSFYLLDIIKNDRIEIFADENMVINVQGFDTAKIRYAVPRYVHIQSKSLNNKILNIMNNQDYWAYQQMREDAAEKYNADQHKAKDSAWFVYLKKEKEVDWIANNKTDKIVAVLIRDFADQPAIIRVLNRSNWRKDTTQAMVILDGLIKKYPWFEDAKKLKNNMIDYLVRTNMLQNGNPAPVFSYPDQNGTLIDLASYKGKYVLIDFWASWCGPCRKSLPKVKEQFALYKDKGFDVLSVSIDEKRTAWLKAVDEENMPWVQVLSPDLDKTMKNYMFSGIPTLYLIGPDGNIVDKYTGYSEEIEEKLKQIFSTIKTNSNNKTD